MRKVMSAIIAISGPERELNKIKFPEGTYEKVYRFVTPDDHGEFPDMGAYESKGFDVDGNEIISHDWEKFTSDMEDSQLYPYMLKCADSVSDYLTSRSEFLETMGFSDIMTTMNGHKFGGKVFAVAGFVSYSKHNNIIVSPMN